MATHQDFVDYVVDQIKTAGALSYRKMFGEYAVYCNGKVVALACDNQLFVKPTRAGEKLLGTPTLGNPYPGAKPHFLASDHLDDADFMTEWIRLTAAELPEPAPKRPRKSPTKQIRK